MKEGWERNRVQNCKPLEPGRKLRKYGPKIDLSTWREESRYADFFDEGRVLTVPKFLQEQGYNPRTIGNAGQQKAFVQQDWESAAVSDVRCCLSSR